MQINKFSDYLEESLSAQMMAEPSSEAAAMAKKMNLTYVGFARYADKSGKVKYIVKNNKLYPFKGKDVEQASIDAGDQQMDAAMMKGDVMAVDTISKKQKASVQGIKADESNKNKYVKQNTKEILAYDKQLRNLYQPSLFTPEEANAIKYYTEKGFNPINRYLYKGFDPETTPDQANQVVQQIQALDNAFEETGAPFDYTTYTGLSSRYDFRKIKPGNDYIFRGYISTSLDHDTAIDMFTFDQNQDVGVVLEIDIKQGQKSIYLENLTDTQGEFETLLPRGTKVKVLAGPMMVDSDVTTSGNIPGKQVALFKCSIVEE
jgi:hypothetical protein